MACDGGCVAWGSDMDRRGLLKLLGAGGAGLLVPAADAMAAGTAYYVSGSGDDDNDGLTPATAFRTLPKAAGLTLPGDTVYAMNGDYVSTLQDSNILTIKRPGASGAPIAFRRFPGHKPRIVVAANNWTGIEIRASHIVVEGFEIAGNAANIGYDYAYSQKNNKNNCATNANGIYVDGRKYGTLHNIAIRANDVHHMPGGGIVVAAADYANISGNQVHSCTWWCVYGNSGISVYSSRDIDSNTRKYKTIVRRNICYDNQNYIPWYQSGRFTDGNGIIVDDNKNTQQTDVPAYKGRTLVVNNLCFNNGGAGVHFYSSARVTCLNNTTYFNNRCPELDSGELSVTDCTNIHCNNNILHARNGKRAQNYKRNVGVEFDYNIYWNGTSVVKGPHDISADPQFVNATVVAADADFRLKAGSPAINSGTTKLAPPEDIDRSPRPYGGRIDRGSYERHA
ncbi:MAG: choice-of-anchor Q domain-containing protein [Hyphomicrobiales bacterium]